MISLDSLRALATPERRLSFAQALSSPGMALVAEVKRASPDSGELRPRLDVAGLVRQYHAAGAAAVAVCTEEDHFRGSLEDLSAAVAATTLPVLRDDFVVDEYQLHEARVAGASAVLLRASILPREELLALGESARRLGLDVVVEVRDEARLADALGLDDAVVGIDNSRPEEEGVGERGSWAALENTFRLVCLVPCERSILVLGGIHTRRDVQRLQAASVDGVLVGERLVSSDDVQAAVAELLGLGG